MLTFIVSGSGSVYVEVLYRYPCAPRSILHDAMQVVATRLPEETKKYEAQRLILSNIKELYGHHCNAFPELGKQIEVSSFFSLRPSYCKTAGSSGTHTVCLCFIHQNFKLMALKVPTVQDYRELVAIAVCDVEKEECMLDCPGGVALEQKFHELFEGEGCDLDDEVKVS